MMIRTVALLVACGALAWGCNDTKSSHEPSPVPVEGAAGAPAKAVAGATATAATTTAAAAAKSANVAPAGAGIIANSKAKAVNPLFDERLDAVKAKQLEAAKAGPATLPGVTKDTPFKGKRLGFVHTANVMGELEPCG